MRKEIAMLQQWGSAFDAVDVNPRTELFPIDPNFRWHTIDNRILTVQEMATPHLWNCIKMVWNHTVPIQFRLIPYKEYKGQANWKKKSKLRRWAIQNLFNELMNRNDRTVWIDAGLFTIATHLTQNKQLKLL